MQKLIPAISFYGQSADTHYRWGGHNCPYNFKSIGHASNPVFEQYLRNRIFALTVIVGYGLCSWILLAYTRRISWQT